MTKVIRAPVVEVTGLEPTTSWSLTKRATKLRYTSVCFHKALTIISNPHFLSSDFLSLFKNSFFGIKKPASFLAGFSAL